LYPLHTALDVRCHFGAPWQLVHPGSSGAGIAPYHLIVKGSAVLDVGPHAGLALQAGDIVMFPRGDAHQLSVGDTAVALPLKAVPGNALLQELENGGPGAATDILCGEFRFREQGVDGGGLLAMLPPVVIVHSADLPEASSLRHLLSILQAEADRPRPGSGAILGHLASALFALLIRAWMAQSATLPGLFAVLAEHRLQAALQGMLAQPEAAWTLESLAASCHMSRATFARLFKQAAGATPAEVLAQLRMAQAARLLEQGQQAVGQVAELVGYQSEAAFNRAFKRQFGVGPGAYRKRGDPDGPGSAPSIA
ncbi:MAG: AraC family transcriptional regulator, partial [Sphingomonadaceae bacterium]